MKIPTLLALQAAALLCGVFTVVAHAAATPIIYPAKGQGSAQTDRDKYECFEWSKGQSGFDPMQPAPSGPTAPMASPAQAAAAPTSSAHPAAGMVKGAAGGAAVAELADRDAGKGAAVGVLGAAVRERMKQQQQQQGAQTQQQQAAQQQAQLLAQQQAARAQQRASFDRGFAACLEGRGYVVK